MPTDDEERLEYTQAKMALNQSEYRIFKQLDAMIERLGEAGVDVSHFPHKAGMVLISVAKEIYANL